MAGQDGKVGGSVGDGLVGKRNEVERLSVLPNERRPSFGKALRVSFRCYMIVGRGRWPSGERI